MEGKIKSTVLTDFYETLIPLYKICRVVGIFPLKSVKVDGKITLKAKLNDRKYLFSYIGGYFLICIYVVYGILVDEENYVVVSKILVLTESLVVLGLMFMTISFCYLFRKVLADCMKLVSEVDEVFPDLDIHIDYTLAKKRNIKILWMLFSSVAIRSLVTTLSLRLPFLQQFMLFIATFIKSLSKYEFILLTLPISLRFNKINKTLIAYKIRRTDMVEDLYKLNRLHFKLCNITRLLNAGFAFQLLSSLGVSLTNILFQAYYLYVLTARKFALSTIAMIASPIVWLIDEFFEIYILVHTCSIASGKANTTSILLHELRNSIRSNALDTHIQMYSLQMLHQKLEFTALGFFTIDYSLLYSILGAVTTYLVIFIQFDQSQHSRNSVSKIVTPGNFTF